MTNGTLKKWRFFLSSSITSQIRKITFLVVFTTFSPYFYYYDMPFKSFVKVLLNLDDLLGRVRRELASGNQYPPVPGHSEPGVPRFSKIIFPVPATFRRFWKIGSRPFPPNFAIGLLQCSPCRFLRSHRGTMLLVILLPWTWMSQLHPNALKLKPGLNWKGLFMIKCMKIKLFSQFLVNKFSQKWQIKK